MIREGGEPLRTRYKKATRNHILRAAEICFAQKGYQSTNLDDVAAMAGVSRAAVYFYFRGKPDLVSALIRMTLDENRLFYLSLPTWEQLAEDDGLLDKWVQSFLGHYRKSRDRRIVLRQAQSADADCRRTIEEGAKEVISVVGQRIGLPADATAAELARARTRIRLASIQSDAICYIWALDKTLSKAEAAAELRLIWERVVNSVEKLSRSPSRNQQ